MAFKLTDPSERMVLFAHPAWVDRLFSWLLAGILFVVAIVALIDKGGVVALFAFLFAFVNAANAFVSHYETDYIITNKRIIVRRGLLSTKQNEVWIADMRGMSLNVSFWQKMLGTGDVMLGTAATAGAEIVIRGISNPQRVIDFVNKYRKGQTTEAPAQQHVASSSGQVVYDPVTHQYVRK